jgi:transposase
LQTVLFPPAPGGGKGVNHGFKGKGSLLHVLVDAQGKCLGITTTGANGDERKELLKLVNKIKSIIEMPKEMIGIEADKGYDSNPTRQELLNRGFLPLIPWRKNNKDALKISDAFKVFKKKPLRWVVERTHAWLKRRYRRLIVRWERKDEIWQGMIQAALILDWVRILLR